VTGANAGLGRATVAGLAGTGAHVLMVCRDRVKGEEARNEIASRTKNEAIDLMIADLSSLASVRALATEFGAKYSKLDVLVNNAGVFLRSKVVTPEGFEKMFATNYLGPFLLTRLLLPYLEAGNPSRIINVTAPSTVKPNLDDLQGERKFSSMGAFGASKAADLLFTYALARRLEGTGTVVNAYHPGIVKTNLNRTAPATVRLIGGLLSTFGGSTPEHAADGLLQLATSDQLADIRGKLVHQGRVVKAPFIDDVDLQEHLWKVSCSMAGVSETV
jgi:NAD(P)-dependent dehydrogenase (short-subunit alcohol dehydrogenase family)